MHMLRKLDRQFAAIDPHVRVRGGIELHGRAFNAARPAQVIGEREIGAGLKNLLLPEMKADRVGRKRNERKEESVRRTAERALGRECEVAEIETAPANDDEWDVN
jgi:hypothetical protein